MVLINTLNHIIHITTVSQQKCTKKKNNIQEYSIFLYCSTYHHNIIIYAYFQYLPWQFMLYINPRFHLKNRNLKKSARKTPRVFSIYVILHLNSLNWIGATLIIFYDRKTTTEHNRQLTCTFSTNRKLNKDTRKG